MTMDPNVRKVLRDCRRTRAELDGCGRRWSAARAGKHIRIEIEGAGFVIIPSSGSDRRGDLNHRREVRKMLRAPARGGEKVVA